MITKQITLSFSIFLLYICSINNSIAQNAKLGNNVYAPILVQGRGITASGVFWSKGINTYFLTAKHIILDTAGSLICPLITLTFYSPGKHGSEKGVIELDLQRAKREGELRHHKVRDVAIIRISYDTSIAGLMQIKFLPHVSLSAFPDTGILTASAVTLFESTTVSNDAFVLGYPAAIGVPEISQLDYSQPLIRKGIVSGKNFQNRTLIIDIPTYPGNSGSPVFEVDDTDAGRTIRLIGVVSQFIPFQEIWVNFPFRYENRQISNSGYSVVEPIDLALDLLR